MFRLLAFIHMSFWSTFITRLHLNENYRMLALRSQHPSQYLVKSLNSACQMSVPNFPTIVWHAWDSLMRKKKHKEFVQIKLYWNCNCPRLGVYVAAKNNVYKKLEEVNGFVKVEDDKNCQIMYPNRKLSKLKLQEYILSISSKITCCTAASRMLYLSSTYMVSEQWD